MKSNSHENLSPSSNAHARNICHITPFWCHPSTFPRHFDLTATFAVYEGWYFVLTVCIYVYIYIYTYEKTWRSKLPGKLTRMTYWWHRMATIEMYKVTWGHACKLERCQQLELDFWLIPNNNIIYLIIMNYNTAAKDDGVGKDPGLYLELHMQEQ